MFRLAMLIAYAVGLFVADRPSVVVKTELLNPVRVYAWAQLPTVDDAARRRTVKPATPLARWRAARPQSPSIFFGGHVFDIVLCKIRRHWGLGAIP